MSWLLIITMTSGLPIRSTVNLLNSFGRTSTEHPAFRPVFDRPTSPRTYTLLTGLSWHVVDNISLTLSHLSRRSWTPIRAPVSRSNLPATGSCRAGSLALASRLVARPAHATTAYHRLVELRYHSMFDQQTARLRSSNWGHIWVRALSYELPEADTLGYVANGG